MGDYGSSKTTASATAATSSKEKPVIVTIAYPAAGHTQGPAQIAKYLIGQGFPVYFIGDPSFRASVEKSGAQYIDYSFNWMALVGNLPKGVEGVQQTLQHVFCDATPTAYPILKTTLERVRSEHPGREVILFQEALSMGVLPMWFGAPLPVGYTTLPKIITFMPSFDMYPDTSLPPVLSGLPYDPTEENLAKWKSLREAAAPMLRESSKYWVDTFNRLGAKITTPFDDMFEVIGRIGDVVILPTSPSLDYPRSRAEPVKNKVRYIGGLPLKPVDPDFVYPEWWSTDVLANNKRKKVIFVTQGTVEHNHAELTMPTIRAFAHRDDVLVISTLGQRGVKLPDDFVIPKNTRVIDFIPYDAVLQHTDVFVTNGGYGSFMHGAMNGVPMVLAGTEADKADVAQRAAWAGVGVSLNTQTPSEEQIREGVDKVLGNPQMKARTIEIKRENEELRSLERVLTIIEELTGSA